MYMQIHNFSLTLTSLDHRSVESEKLSILRLNFTRLYNTEGTWSLQFLRVYHVFPLLEMRAGILRLLLTDIHSSPSTVPSISRDSLNIWIIEWLNTKSKCPSSFVSCLCLMWFLFPPLGEGSQHHLQWENLQLFFQIMPFCHGELEFPCPFFLTDTGWFYVKLSLFFRFLILLGLLLAEVQFS